ncbi:PucR family transcriptional regulator [[Mycobacterium] vasticus]|uniref:PucR family transcriptional regulator n=1 Tax=[Mycobacterium] vasticus TaxID=2875777 RepID=A0ABU5YR62_9MYCO|nr:PucR family transcriptional regulator [Mycolicibacter sp. MYC017]MEB3067596.1 PucR family transcriptional regulator [Mycolicibacter sp. MYC017]
MTSTVWARPSKRVRELIQQGARSVIDTRPWWFAGARQDMLSSSEYLGVIANDPVAVEAVDRSNRSNQIHWAAANISHPGEPVPPNLGTEALAIARYLVRLGIDEAAVVDMYRLAQNATVRAWMQIVFSLTSDPDEMRELFDVSERSITSFLGATVSGIHRQMAIERNELVRGTHAERRQIVALILDAAPIPLEHAQDQLGYQLEQEHTAAVIWGDESATDQSDLAQAAEMLIQGQHGQPALSVLASAATRWIWLSGPTGPELDARSLRRIPPGVRIALGPTTAGIEGFRTSHLDAITTQRMMARLGSTQQVARFSEVELVSLINAEPEQADRFITHTLGDFEFASTELHRTVLTFVREQCNAARASARLFTHRNTLLRRLSRANELLPQPLDGSSVHVAVALEALAWRGAAGRRAVTPGG